MKRSSFLKSAGLLAVHPSGSVFFSDNDRKIKIPQMLKQGDQIGICSPAGFITTEEIEPCKNALLKWGFRVLVGSSIGEKWNSFGGTDEERRKDLQRMLDDEELKAILCARGGYGMVRIIDLLDFSRFRKHPKWILGFSDITVLHAHLNAKVGVASMHCKMCNSFPDSTQPIFAEQQIGIESIFSNLTGRFSYRFPYSPSNRTGACEGQLVGGNLRTLESISGSISELNTDGKILFVEDTGEYLYSIDRMFWNLLRSGKLEHLKGLLIGGIKPKPDDPGEAFGISVEDIVLEKVKSYSYPVAFNLPVGHQKLNVALKCGVNYRLLVTDRESEIAEI